MAGRLAHLRSNPDPFGQEPIGEPTSQSRFRPVYHAVPGLRFAGDVHGAWHGGTGQDQVVFKLLNRKTSGYFVDLAAQHPIYLSNTRALERDHSWTGLCIEPNPRFWDLLRGARSCAVVGAAIASEEGMLQLSDQRRGSYGVPGARSVDHAKLQRHMQHNRSIGAGPMMSSFQIRAQPFDKLLREMEAPRVVDYVSLDVDGDEQRVMASFPFSTHMVCVLTVPRPTRPLQKRLEMHGYQLLCTQGDVDVWGHRAVRPRLSAAVMAQVSDCGGRPRCERILDPTWMCPKKEASTVGTSI